MVSKDFCLGYLVKEKAAVVWSLEKVGFLKNNCYEPIRYHQWVNWYKAWQSCV
jgi:hypothetical protein